MHWLVASYSIDPWTALHFLGWALLAAEMVRRGVYSSSAVILCLAAGVWWELVEWRLVEPLLNFHEPWLNRWCFDLLADIIGAMFGVQVAADAKFEGVVEEL